ncbi:1,4-alpha-glucan branching enzyme [Pedococcus cremeus]|uniref:1,4-alpha-glucan branching enzyme GlgB n=2 Tax=Pedococcus cremeus TaxID=587636 RepID=A0A1H9UEQ1_9MICO|nr:1,4-alpha-glucan branching protein GlgB [Pedococcus cremeus]SES07832.1 1,4-alpha-glucan branching enzyme [Pedococcus cremeus]
MSPMLPKRPKKTQPENETVSETVNESANETVNETVAPEDVLPPLGGTSAADEPAAPTPADATSADRDPQPEQPAPTAPDMSGAIEALAAGRHQQPHDLLGQHLEGGGLRVRVLRPMARSVVVGFEDGERIELHHEAHGVWTGVREGCDRTMDYRVHVAYDDGIEHEQDDPYRFAPTLGEVDRHLIGEGRHEQLWTVLGAHVREYDGPMGSVRGTSFAVWAPHARAVHVIGDFNGWDPVRHPMRLLGESGVWELFIPGVGEGNRYKYEIRGSDDIVRSKADPMAQATEVPPATGSVVTRSQYEWADDAWMERRRTTDPHSGPMSIYEVHLGSWRQGHSYRDLAEHLVNYVSDLGFTHVEFLPVMEHPYGPSWGYQVTGYYAPTARFGSPDDFRYLVDRLHQAGIGVILDWVPAHFPRDAWALAKFDGQALYEHPDPRRGDQPDWGTHIFDFGRMQVRNFLVANAIYWLEEFHIDGLRVDAVASMLYLDYSRQEGQWLPNQYGGRENLEAIGLLQETNATTYKRVPGIVTVAEESTSWPGVTRATSGGGLGFGLKWNMGWMNDSLRYIGQDPVHRQYHHNLLTFSLMYAYSENYVLPISHDEVVHGKGSLLRKIPGSRYDQLATLRAYLAYIWTHPGKQLVFMGSEFAQEAEWADGRELDWWLLDHPAHYRIHNLVKELNHIYRTNPALWALDSSPAGFEWLNADDNAGNTFSYLRFGAEDRQSGPVVAVVVNFSGMAHDRMRIGVPRPGRWKVVLDTSGFDEFGTPSQADVVVEAQEHPADNQPYSVEVRVAPLSSVWLAPVEAPAIAGSVQEQVSASRQED